MPPDSCAGIMSAAPRNPTACSCKHNVPDQPVGNFVCSRKEGNVFENTEISQECAILE
jgi:hypothetical protein